MRTVKIKKDFKPLDPVRMRLDSYARQHDMPINEETKERLIKILTNEPIKPKVSNFHAFLIKVESINFELLVKIGSFLSKGHYLIADVQDLLYATHRFLFNTLNKIFKYRTK